MVFGVLPVSRLIVSLLAVRSSQAQEPSPAHTSPTHAQDDAPSALNTILPQQRIELLPRRVVLDGRTRTTTLTITNHANKTTTAELRVVFAYSVWPHGLPYDTMLFSTHWESLVPHDTMVIAPSTTDPSAAQWISGVPNQVTLSPHETKRITVRIDPPPNIQHHEYWARIVATASPSRKNNNPGKPKDEKTIYRLPIRGITPQPLRDSTLVFYRPGPVTMDINTAGHSAAALDAHEDYPHPPVGCPCRRVWYRIPVHLTGNAVYQGTLHVKYVSAETGQAIYEQLWELTLYHDAVIHGWGEWHPSFQPGKYRLLATFDNSHSEVEQSLPMRSVIDTIPFEVVP